MFFCSLRGGREGVFVFVVGRTSVERAKGTVYHKGGSTEQRKAFVFPISEGGKGEEQREISLLWRVDKEKRRKKKRKHSSGYGLGEGTGDAWRGGETTRSFSALGRGGGKTTLLAASPINQEKKEREEKESSSTRPSCNGKPEISDLRGKKWIFLSVLSSKSCLNHSSGWKDLDLAITKKKGPSRRIPILPAAEKKERRRWRSQLAPHADLNW